MNIENKKQIAILFSAVILGFFAVLGVGFIIESSVKKQTKAIGGNLKKSTGMLKNELQSLNNGLSQLANQQKQLAQRQKDLEARQAARPTAQQPKGQSSEPKGLFSLITPIGKRAVTIRVRSLSAIGGLVNPGDYVDILGELNVPKDKVSKNVPNKITTILFQNVQILAIGTNFDTSKGSTGYPAQQSSSSLILTLALTPEEVGLLAFAQKNGELQLSLRSPQDGQKETLEIASWDTLSDYVENAQGTDLLGPKKKKIDIEDVDYEEPEAVIQIFKSGREIDF